MNTNKLLGILILFSWAVVFIANMLQIIFLNSTLMTISLVFGILIPLYVKIAAYRFKKNNDTKGEFYSRMGFYSFIAIIVVPLIILFFGNTRTQLDAGLNLVLISVAPIIFLCLSVITGIRLFKSNTLNVLE